MGWAGSRQYHHPRRERAGLLEGLDTTPETLGGSRGNHRHPWTPGRRRTLLSFLTALSCLKIRALLERKPCSLGIWTQAGLDSASVALAAAVQRTRR